MKTRWTLAKQGFVNEDGSMIEDSVVMHQEEKIDVDKIPHDHYAFQEEFDGINFVEVGERIFPEEEYEVTFKIKRSKKLRMVMGVYYGDFKEKDFKGNFNAGGNTFLIEVENEKEREEYHFNFSDVLSGIKRAIGK